MTRVLAVGCFDLLHPGHIAHLLAAKQFGSVVVGLTEDETVLAEKGPGHPLFPWTERYNMLAAIRYVDKIIPHRNFHQTVMTAKPDIVIKGMDWKDRMEHEREWLEEMGIKLVHLDTKPVYSSTKIMSGELFSDRCSVR